MIEELVKKLDIVLKAKFPDDAEREERVKQAGEIIFYESGEEALRMLKEKKVKENIISDFVDYMAVGNYAAAILLCSQNDINLGKILEEKSKDVSILLFQM